MAEKPRFTAGKKKAANRQPLPDPATDAFPAEKDVAIPPPGSDQTVGSPDAKAGQKGRPHKPD
ncbi:hypothetical protein [Luteolibacter soli]|uniref:hypothetical protein n=1 Tax=Luteolibacter soli TaxID=3135280 RepID=UPI003119E256